MVAGLASLSCHTSRFLVFTRKNVHARDTKTEPDTVIAVTCHLSVSLHHAAVGPRSAHCP